MNTWFLCPSNIQHGRTVETASADKSFLPWRRFHTRLWALSLQWLWLKWGHLFYAVLPKLSVPSKRARDWHRKQWKLQSLSFCRIIPKKKSPLKDVLVGQQIILEFNLVTWNGIFHDAKEEFLPSTNAFWFAWYAFHPETQILRSSN